MTDNGSGVYFKSSFTDLSEVHFLSVSLFVTVTVSTKTQFVTKMVWSDVNNRRSLLRYGSGGQALTLSAQPH